MLDVLERFELESADRGHGAFFPDNQPQLPTPRVFEGLGPSPIWRPAAALFRGVVLALKTGGGHCSRFCLPAFQVTPHTPSHTGHSWRASGASQARASLVECARNDGPASGRVFPMCTLGGRGSAVVVVPVTLVEPSALLCGWG